MFSGYVIAMWLLIEDSFNILSHDFHVFFGDFHDTEHPKTIQIFPKYESISWGLKLHRDTRGVYHIYALVYDASH